jgi:hypothetical protein
MDESTRGPDAVRRQVDGELRLVHEAILLVASGGSPRVLVAGLRLGHAVLEPAGRLARASGVTLVPLWTTDEQQLDIRVEVAER